MMKRYAVLYVPEFRLQATLRYAWHLKNDQPVALMELKGQKSCVAELNAPARAAQVEAGMSPTQARARCAELHLLFANRGHERSARDVLLQTAETISPFFEITEPGVITVEWPQEKTAEEKSLTQSVVTPLRKLGLSVRLGLADRPFLAGLASRLADPVRIIDEPAAFLNSLPVETLQPTPEISGVLQSWGIRTIQDLTALPMEEVGERLGPEAVELWERATGGRARPLRLVKSPEFFFEETDLENPLEMLEPLLFILRRFLKQIAARLAQVHLVAGKVRLVLHFEQGPPHQRTFTIPQPTRDVDLLFRMLHTHLENFTSTSPVIALKLAAQPVRAGTPQFDLLEKGLRDPHQLAETLARLQALLGAERVGTPEIEPSHHPEAFHLRPYDSNPAPVFPPMPLRWGCHGCGLARLFPRD